MLNKGLTYTAEAVVDNTNTAAAIGSGDMDVLATPAMVALMESAAMNAVAGHLPEGSSTVGTIVDISHNRATPIGKRVTATATLQEIDGRKLIFHVSASDDKGVVGEGVHERFIVDRERFLGKLL
jgi:predicted thioesterase